MKGRFGENHGEETEKRSYYAEIPSDINLVDEEENKLNASLVNAGWAEEEYANLDLALREGLINAIRHGNKNDRSKTVKLSVEVSPTEVSITITDDGSGFEPEKVPDPTKNSGLLKENGRGLFFIEEFTDHHEYADGGRTLIMVKRRKENGQR